MKFFTSLFLLTISFFHFANAQIRVVNRKGTVLEVDSSKWTISGVDIANKNSGNVGIGKTATAKFDVKGNVNSDSTISAVNYTSKVQNTASGATYTWNLNLGANTSWTLSSGANTLTISNVKAGMYGLIRLINSGTSTLTFASGTHKVINGGGGIVTLTQSASAVDILTFYYDGSTYWWTIGNNYS